MNTRGKRQPIDLRDWVNRALPHLLLMASVAVLAWGFIESTRILECRRLEMFLLTHARGAAAALALRVPATFRVLQSFATRFQFRQDILKRHAEICRKHLEQILVTEPDLDRVFLTDPAGVLFSDAPADPSVLGQSFASRDWYRGLSARWEPYFSKPYRRAALGQPMVVALAVPVALDGRIVGALVGHFLLSKLGEFLTTYATNPGLVLYLVEENGEILAHSGNAATAPTHLAEGPLLDCVRRDSQGNFTGKPHAGARPIFSAFSSVAGTSWRLVVEQDLERGLGPFLASRARLMLVAALLYASLLGLMLQRQRKNRSLARAAADLRRKNQDLEGMMRTVSHDLKSPLVSIDSLLGLLKEDMGSAVTGEAGRTFEMLGQTVGRMRALIEDILTFARVDREDLPLQMVDTGAVIDRVLLEQQSVLDGKGISVTVAGPFPQVRANDTGLYQVFGNLVSNAAKFLGTTANPRIVISCEPEGDCWVFRVRDNGVGIDRHQQERIFHAFTRIEEVEAEGTGLGLPIVRAIVEKFGGSVGVVSEKNQGASFEVRLPR